MSFRELRSFSETMRLLGYPRLISMDSFRSPNVELVADCLYWLIKRYEPSAEVAYNIERENDRITFFKQVCEVALVKGRIKLNIKKLYQADGHAVQEMLKLASVLKDAMRATDEEDPDFAGLQQMAAQKNATDAKGVQQLCSALTADGSSLFFMIEEEMTARGERQRVLSRATEVGEFERRLRELLSSVSQQVEQLQQSITNLSADETTLEQKIENKKVQHERAQKRFRSLSAVRPAYLEEYEKHEAELQEQFMKYLEQYRNLEYLEYQLAKYNAKEDAMLEEQETKLRVMRERLRKEMLKSIKAEGGQGGRGGRAQVPDSDDDDDDDSDVVPARRPHVRDAAAEGSSEEESSDEEEDDVGSRPQNAMGRTRPSPSEELAWRQQQMQRGRVIVDSDEDDNAIGNMRRTRVGGSGGSSTANAAMAPRDAALNPNPGRTVMRPLDSEDSSDDDDSSDLSTSTDDDDDDDSDLSDDSDDSDDSDI